MGKSSINGPCSMAMLNNQSVYSTQPPKIHKNPTDLMLWWPFLVDQKRRPFSTATVTCSVKGWSTWARFSTWWWLMSIFGMDGWENLGKLGKTWENLGKPGNPSSDISGKSWKPQIFWAQTSHDARIHGFRIFRDSADNTGRSSTRQGKLQVH